MLFFVEFVVSAQENKQFLTVQERLQIKITTTGCQQFTIIFNCFVVVTVAGPCLKSVILLLVFLGKQILTLFKKGRKQLLPVDVLGFIAFVLFLRWIIKQMNG